MSRVEQCPICFGELEVRSVQPCFVCGWAEEIKPSKLVYHFSLRDDGSALTLCDLCWLEEVLSDQGDLKKCLRISGERDLVIAPDRLAQRVDKFCPSCKRRGALLELMARRLSDEELDRWRG